MGISFLKQLSCCASILFSIHLYLTSLKEIYHVLSFLQVLTVKHINVIILIQPTIAPLLNSALAFFTWCLLLAFICFPLWVEDIKKITKIILKRFVVFLENKLNHNKKNAIPFNGVSHLSYLSRMLVSGENLGRKIALNYSCMLITPACFTKDPQGKRLCFCYHSWSNQ